MRGASAPGHPAASGASDSPLNSVIGGRSVNEWCGSSGRPKQKSFVAPLPRRTAAPRRGLSAAPAFCSRQAPRRRCVVGARQSERAAEQRGVGAAPAGEAGPVPGGLCRTANCSRQRTVTSGSGAPRVEKCAIVTCAAVRRRRARAAQQRGTYRFAHELLGIGRVPRADDERRARGDGGLGAQEDVVLGQEDVVRDDHGCRDAEADEEPCGDHAGLGARWRGLQPRPRFRGGQEAGEREL